MPITFAALENLRILVSILENLHLFSECRNRWKISHENTLQRFLLPHIAFQGSTHTAGYRHSNEKIDRLRNLFTIIQYFTKRDENITGARGYSLSSYTLASG